MKALALLSLLATSLPAQTPDPIPPAAFNGLRTPASPAFVLLGIAPTAVERPNTPADLALSALNHSAAFTSLPRDVAVEFSPYWLLGHPTLTWQADTTRSVGASLSRTATISFATAELGTSLRPITGLALALRAAPFSGRLSDTTIAQLRGLEARLTDESVLLNELMREPQNALRNALNQELAAAQSKADTAAALGRFNAARATLAQTTMSSARFQEAVDSTETMLGTLASIRQGFVLEFAAGAMLQAPGAAADSASLGRWGAWITAGYEGPAWSFVFVNRFLAGAADSTFDGMDLGMRVLYASGRYALSAEGLFRTFTEPGAPANEYRFAAVVDYEVHPGFWLTGTFGRDYRAAAPGSLIAQFGLSVDFAGERIKIPKP